MSEEGSATQPPQDDDTNEETQAPPATDKKNATDYESLYLRAKADLENYRNQAAREKSDTAKFACENLILQILPVLDNFKRAAAHLPEDLAENEWVKGIAGIEKQFESVLESAGLKKIEAQIGKSSDANFHEAIAVGVGEAGKILEVIEDGYELNGKVIRASKVKVGDGKVKNDA